MSILEQLGRQTIRLGSSEACELRVDERGVAHFHAEIVHQGNGRLLFVPGTSGPCFANGQRLQPAVPVPFDFQSRFFLDQAEVPLTDDAICRMVMRRGNLTPDPDELVVGRDPERAHLVLTSPGVSGRHASLHFGRGELVDHDSTSGTWFGGRRLAPEVPASLAHDGLIAIGPLPLPVRLAREIHQALLDSGVKRRAQTTLYMQRREGQPEPATEAPPPPFVVAQDAPPTKAPSVPPMPVSPGSARHRTVMGTVRMELSRARSIGRTPDNDIVLDQPQVSSRHAQLLSAGGQLFLEDLGSELGTYVRGARLRPGQRIPVKDGERVLFGPMTTVLRVQGAAVDLLIEDQADWMGRPLFEIEARHLSVSVQDRDAPSERKLLLDDVSFRALPGDLIALMGPSGSGKTTLLHVLTGYRPPTEGEVLVNGEPLATIFDALRGSIGYVPQDDIIHPELTVWEAVRYSARFRLPSDYSDEEIDRRVQSTLLGLGLDGVAHLQIGKPEAKVLSGGQRKRVNIALELVTDPVLLFLDEPTSGLAADDTAALVELLANLAKDTGKTIIATIHQPAKHEYEKFNLALVLGQGGVPIYYGPTKDAYAFFESWRAPQDRSGIDNPRDMFAEISEREARSLQTSGEEPRAEVRREVARAFRRDWETSNVFERMQDSSRGVGSMLPREHVGSTRRRPQRQFRLLVQRYLRVKARDRVGTAILLAQAPLIGVLLALVFGSQKESVPYWCLGALEELTRRGDRVAENVSGVLSRMTATSDNAGALFFLVVAAVWFGTSNAAREIVSERSIYRRERMVNLGVVEYVGSKFLVLGALSTAQCSILLAIVFWALGLGGGPSGFFIALGMLILTALCSVALGLLLSAVVESSEAAMALTPIALIPQVVLGGLMVPATTVAWLRLPMLAVPARWGFEGVVRGERLSQADSPAWLIQLGDVPESPPDYLSGGAFRCAEAQLKSNDFLGAWGFSTADNPAVAASVLTLMTVLCLIVVMLELRRGDQRRG